MDGNASEIHKFQEDSGMTFEEVFGFAYGPIFSGLLRSLREELGDDRFIEVLKGAATRCWEEEGHKAAGTVSGNDWSAFWAVANPVTAGLENPDRFWGHALTQELIEDTDHAREIKVTECLWAKTLRELDAADIGYAAICHGDYDYCQGFNPKIRMIRTKTLMQGDDYCDHRWVWED